MLKPININAIIACFNKEIQFRPRGREVEKGEAKVEMLGILKDEIIARRGQGLTLQAISDSVAVASGGLLGIRDLRAALAKWERRSNKLGRPKNSCRRPRRKSGHSTADARPAVEVHTEEAPCPPEPAPKPDMAGLEETLPEEKPSTGDPMEDIENPFPLLPEEDARYEQGTFF